MKHLVSDHIVITIVMPATNPQSAQQHRVREARQEVELSGHALGEHDGGERSVWGGLDHHYDAQAQKQANSPRNPIRCQNSGGWASSHS